MVSVVMVSVAVVGLSTETYPLGIIALRLDHLDRPEASVCPGLQLLPDTTPAVCKQPESQGSLESWTPGARGDVSEAAATVLQVGSQCKLGADSQRSLVIEGAQAHQLRTIAAGHLRQS